MEYQRLNPVRRLQGKLLAYYISTLTANHFLFKIEFHSFESNTIFITSLPFILISNLYLYLFTCFLSMGPQPEVLKADSKLFRITIGAA